MLKYILCLAAVWGPSIRAQQAPPPTGNDGTLYVNPRSSLDLITQVNALYASCFNRCRVHIPAGSYTIAIGTIAMHNHGQSLTADGKNLVTIHYSGTNFLDLRYTGADYDASYSQGGEISGFTLIAPNPMVRAFTIGSVQNLSMHDVTIIGPAGIVNAGNPGTSQAFVFQNTYNWMERTALHDITIGGFLINKHWMAPAGAGTDSFAYGVYDGLHENVGPRGASVLVDVGASVYHTLKYQGSVNASHTTANDTLFQIDGAFNGTDFHFAGEGSFANFANVAASGSFLFDGAYSTFGGIGNVGPGTSFGIGPGSSSTPLLGTLSPIGTMLRFGGSSETAYVYPWVTLDGPLHYAPSSIAGLSWLSGNQPTGTGALPTSWMLTHDTGLPACVATITGASYGQLQSKATPQQCFDGATFRSPEATIGGIAATSTGVTIRTVADHGPNLVQTGKSADGLWNLARASSSGANQAWTWGIEPDTLVHPGRWYFQSGATPTHGVTPELEITPGVGLVTTGLQIGSGAVLTNSSRLVRATSGAVAGTCTINGYVEVEISGAKLRLATCK